VQHIAALKRTGAKIDQAVLQKANDKQKKRLGLSKREEQVLRNAQEIREELGFLDYCRRVPQKLYRLFSGRQTKVLQEQAERYGLPVAGAVIDLPRLIASLHGFLASNKYRFHDDAEGDPDMQGGDSPALERYRHEKALIARMERLEREGRLLKIEDVEKGFLALSEILRRSGETLQRVCGAEAHAIHEQGLADVAARFKAMFPGANQTGDDDGAEGTETE